MSSAEAEAAECKDDEEAVVVAVVDSVAADASVEATDANAGKDGDGAADAGREAEKGDADEAGVGTDVVAGDVVRNDAVEIDDVGGNAAGRDVGRGAARRAVGVVETEKNSSLRCFEGMNSATLQFNFRLLPLSLLSSSNSTSTGVEGSDLLDRLRRGDADDWSSGHSIL